MNLDALPSLKDVIAAHDLRADKALGQNFLLDGNITDKIAGFAGVSGRDHVLEIGPGPGGLTRSILRAGAGNVTAIEYDARAVGALQDLLQVSEGRLRVEKADALEVDLTSLSEAPRRIIANLPYNVATPLLVGWLKQLRAEDSAYASMTLMFQKEVADRITAAPGSKAYGRLAVLCQWLCTVRNVYTLPPQAFTPPPKVQSSVVHFVPRSLPNEAPAFEAVEAVTAAAFGQRRKMVRSSLRDYVRYFEDTGLDPTARAEELALEDFVALAYKKQNDTLPRN